MTDPHEFRYDKKTPAQTGHEKPPAGLVPTVNPVQTPPVTPPPAIKDKVVLSQEQQKRRLTLLSEMRESIAEIVPQPPAEKQEGEQTAESQPVSAPASSGVMTLMEALGSPAMKSIRFGVIGTGQCGNRLAEQFFQFGYNVVAMNTAQQDLQFIQIPDERKLHLPYALGGAGKDILVGQQAAYKNLPEIIKLLDASFKDVDQILICTSGGGGTGAGSLIPLLEAIGSVESIAGLPIVIMYTLPMNDEGAQAKSNAIKTLDRIARIANDDMISSIIIIDNSKIQERHLTVSVKDFWKLANFDIINLLNMFNSVSKCATHYDALDPMDFANILSTGGCLIYGRADIKLQLDDKGQVTLDEQKLTQALLSSAQEGVLAEGFDLRQAQRIGVVITSSEQILAQIPAIAINYALNQLTENVGNDATIYKGVYTDEDAVDTVSVFTIFAGLGLPQERIARLKAEAAEASHKIEVKQKIKLSVSETPATEKKDVYENMRHKNSSMGRMIDKKRPIR